MNRDELSVYADQLQIEGDIRGEIIALELLIEHGKQSELVARHERLATGAVQARLRRVGRFLRSAA